ncbi:hypothetical protein RJ639_020321 [Escallonia herrerae]|uniref:Phytocyanin domain-containing protein n=1 Tax=Escallonia herrerae TaxID=1293975 RepID=A0AA88V594_9ASTE|nr:hypothetical protein RJ639_020321 [Escallonia herrerae]
MAYTCSMAASSITPRLALFLAIFASLQHLYVSYYEFQVGDNDGWVVPSENDSKKYNDWASKIRFTVDDFVRFKYIKDSVMAVTPTDYERCNSLYPNFFSNNGDTIFKLNHTGPFYFISGVAGHCERGQRMIVKVISQQKDDYASVAGGGRSIGASNLVIILIHFVLLYLVSYLF